MQNKRRFLQRCNPHKTRQVISRCEKLTLEQGEPLWKDAYEDLAFDQALPCPHPTLAGIARRRSPQS